MRKSRTVFLAKCFAVLSAIPLVVYSFSTGPPAQHTGAPGENTCSQCHFGGPGGGSVEIRVDGGPNYTPGVAMKVHVEIHDTAAGFGFQLSARKASDNSQAGTLNPDDSETGIRVICSDNTLRPAGGCPSVEYIEHSTPRTRNQFDIVWTPPSTAVGQVKLYAAANAANLNGNPSGDSIYSTSVTLDPAPAGGGGPTIGGSNLVTNGASFAPGITPGAWASLFGQNLAPTTRLWRDDEIIDGKLPTSLDGVSVTIDGKPAAVYFISPAQVNVLVPNDIGLGNAVSVKLTNAQGSSEVSVVATAIQPGWFTFDGTNIAAQHSDNVTLVGSNGQFDLPSTHPAAPGETIVLWGTGFGQTNPQTPSDHVVTTRNELDKTQLHVTIGGQPASITFAGITIFGVYQINVQVPAGLSAGDQAVVAEIAGQRTQDGAVIKVQ